jgi:hypothetical protein
MESTGFKKDSISPAQMTDNLSDSDLDGPL